MYFGILIVFGSSAQILNVAMHFSEDELVLLLQNLEDMGITYMALRCPSVLLLMCRLVWAEMFQMSSSLGKPSIKRTLDILIRLSLFH